VNKARLQWHKERQANTADYWRKRNAQSMREWQEDWEGVDRQSPVVLEVHADVRQARGVKLVQASQVLEGERREGALKRAGRLLREADAMKLRASRLRAGEKPLDEWALCRCGGAFQPGPRGYTQCYNCSQKDWLATSYACVFCERRHSMSYPLCFACKQDSPTAEDDARFIRLMINQRDNYTCQMCGLDAMTEGAELQVDHINPDGGNWQWNLQTLCGTCSALKGKSYDKLDEREYWKLITAYWGPLYDYLNSEEKAELDTLEPDVEHEQIDFGHRPVWRTEDAVDEREGIMNVITMLGAVLVHG
jgi:5-methylcytosine-specific restriction endonuclease McrA